MRKQFRLATFLWLVGVSLGTTVLGSCAPNASSKTKAIESPRQPAPDTRSQSEAAYDRAEAYLRTEVLDGKKPVENINDGDYARSVFGEPKEIKDEPVNEFDLEGSKVSLLRHFIYDDMIHTFYVTSENKLIYASARIDHPLGRLKSINVGDSRDKVIEVFGKDFGEYRKDLLVFHANIAEVQFQLEQEKVRYIFLNYFLE